MKLLPKEVAPKRYGDLGWKWCVLEGMRRRELEPSGSGLGLSVEYSLCT